MTKAQSLQLMYATPKSIFDGFFAGGVLNDYRADWALVTDFEQLEKSVKTIQRNPG